MGTADHLTQPRCQPRQYHAGLTRHRDDVHLITQIISPLHQCQRDDNALLTAAVDAHVARTIIHTYHLVIGRIDTDELSAGIASLWEKRLIYFLADNTYLTRLGDVHLVEIAAIIEAGLFHLDVLGHKSFQRSRRLLVSKHEVAAPVGEHRCDDIKLRHLRLQTVDVLVIHVPLTSFAEAVIRLRRVLGKDEG